MPSQSLRSTNRVHGVTGPVHPKQVLLIFVQTQINFSRFRLLIFGAPALPFDRDGRLAEGLAGFGVHHHDGQFAAGVQAAFAGEPVQVVVSTAPFAVAAEKSAAPLAVGNEAKVVVFRIDGRFQVLDLASRLAGLHFHEKHIEAGPRCRR